MFAFPCQWQTVQALMNRMVSLPVALCIAGELQPILDQKSEATAQLLVTVAADREEASKVQQVVEKDASEVQVFQKEVQAIADDAKADLAEALPVLESAVKSLNALNKSDIVEMKSFSKPPPLVMLTMEAVCTLRQEKPDWDTALDRLIPFIALF